MVGFINWLRSHGWAGNLGANIVQFLCAYKGITAAGAVTMIFTFLDGATEWAQQSSVWIPAAFFLFSLWTIIGIVFLRNINVTKTVRTAHDYAYSFIIDGGFQANFGTFPANHPTNPNADAIMVTCLMRNVGAGPARLHLEELRVVLDGRTADDSPPIELNFARLAHKGIRSGGIQRDATKSHLSGTVTYKFLYGPPDGEFVRRYTIKAKIDVTIDLAKDLVATDNHSIEEKDEPLVTQ